MQRARGDRPVDDELAAQPVRRPAAGCTRRCGRGHPGRAPVRHRPSQPTATRDRNRARTDRRDQPSRCRSASIQRNGPSSGCGHRVHCCHADGAHPGRDHRRRTRGHAAGAPAGRRGRRVGGGRDPVGGVRRLADPGRHPRAVHRRPAARGRSRRPAGAARATSTAASTCSGPGERHHLDFVDLTGRSVWVYGQTEVQKDLVAAARDRGQAVHYEVADTALHDLESETPSVTFTSPAGEPVRLEASVVVGCDGSFGPSRSAVPSPATWERTYPYSWLGILADVAPSTDELIYAWHPDGLRAALDAVVVGVAVLPPGAQRHLARRLVRRPDLGGAGHPARHGLDGWTLDDRPDHRPLGAADALVRADADAPRPAVPRRRRRAHRPAHRRQGAQPRGRRRRPPRPRARRAGSARTTPRSPTRTPTPRSAGSGAARTSPGG